jgi:hypothetical protein
MNAQRIDHVLHRFDRAREQDVILAGALVDALEQFVVFLDEGFEEWAVIRRNSGQQFFKGCVSGLVKGCAKRFHGGEADFASLGKDGRLRLDVRDAFQDGGGGAAHHQILLIIEAGEHFSVLLEFLAEGADEFVHNFCHIRLPG